MLRRLGDYVACGCRELIQITLRRFGQVELVKLSPWSIAGT
jgi:hypothetical protein